MDKWEIQEVNESQKTIDQIKSCTYIDNESRKLIVNALEKQIPKKPIKNSNFGKVEKFFREDTYTCPRCSNSCLTEFAANGREDNRHCYCCGQRLDWSEVKGI